MCCITAAITTDVARKSRRFERDDHQGQLNKLCVEVEHKENEKLRLKGANDRLLGRLLCATELIDVYHTYAAEIIKLEQDLASLRKSNADQSGMLRNMQDVLNFRAKQTDIGEANLQAPSSSAV